MGAATKPSSSSAWNLVADFDASAVNKYFSGQGGVFFGSVNGDVPTSSGTNFTEYVTWVGAGEALGDSTTYNGEAASSTDIVNEQGAVVVSNTTAGTIGYQITMLSTSEDAIVKYLNGTKGTKGIGMGSIKGTFTYAGFGTKVPEFNTIFGLISADGNRMLVIPNAKISGELIDAASQTNMQKIQLSIKAMTHNLPMENGSHELVYMFTRTSDENPS